MVVATNAVVVGATVPFIGLGFFLGLFLPFGELLVLTTAHFGIVNAFKKLLEFEDVGLDRQCFSLYLMQ
jgi:hypothetical protein